MKFEWSGTKAISNQQKHGVSFEEASTVFADFLSITVADPFHPSTESRFVTVGLSKGQRLLVVVHKDQGDVIRLISARVATAQERKRYESDG
ncbi:BrnT family toxin [Ectothiorhodospira sp. 9100]|nr:MULTISPECIES: BrnT family toxin [unclassified Ectothiorhodospira]MCG5515137.1 BrnT family toxin [Ectothiorhodospira sp. 9100]MCG5520271.1 BrnT family toxin [Ectothiorhodospira sp. 9905]